jgi:alkyldihydroxyacetonephosphate synthase
VEDAGQKQKAQRNIVSSISPENPERLKWWGWGLEGQSYMLPDPQSFWSSLESTLGSLQHASRITSIDEIALPPPRLAPADLAALKKRVGESGVTIEAAERAVHALGKSYVDLLQIRQGQVKAAPDAVLFPEEEQQVQAVLELAAERDWVVVPFGGGTSVVGGVEPISEGQPVLTLDLKLMNRVLEIDRASNTARIQGGIRGPELESQLSASGFTLGHFPQSFEFSTLGGWIATRSAGQNSTKYGKIEHMVVGLRIVTPTAVLDSPVVPAAAVGPSLLQCLIGSEGTLGVITQAVVRVHPIPQHRAFITCLFPDFTTGLSAVRNMLQADIRPAVLRLSDPDETAMAMLLSKAPHPSVKERLGNWYVRFRGFDLEQSALVILIFEGNRSHVSAASRQARSFLKSGLYLGSSPARLWLKSRFHHPYLRDDLLDRSVMVDTLETAAPWEKLPTLYTAVRQALSESILNTAPGSLVFTHLSHAYPDGASLYFTFMARQQAGRELEQWHEVKEAATETILKHGGALSHHHGVGSMHKPWMRSYLGPEGLAFLEHMKEKVDPKNIMNPGKLLGN